MTNMTQWECPICFKEMGDVDVICMHECSHISCYQCLETQVAYFRKTDLNPTDILCSLCRAPVQKEYKTTPRLNPKVCISFAGKSYKLYYI